MPTISITDEALEYMHKFSEKEGRVLEDNAEPDGILWEIEIEESTLKRLELAALRGETYSDTILRIASQDRAN